MIILICCFWYIIADWEPHQLSSSPLPPPKCVGVFCLGMHGGQDLEKLVLLGLGSPLVRRCVSGKNVNTGLPWEEDVRIGICSLSAVKHRTHNQRTFHWWRGVGGRKWEGRRARPGGTEAWKEGGGERREVLFEISCSSPAPTVCR